MLGKERLTTCPLFFSKCHPHALRHVLKLKAMFDKGFLPDTGGYYDQSNLTMEALDIVTRALGEAKEEAKATPGRR